MVWVFLNEEAGVTAVEYCLFASLVALAIFSAVTSIGPKLDAGVGQLTGGL